MGPFNNTVTAFYCFIFNKLANNSSFESAEADKAKERMLRDKLDREKAAGTYEVTVQTKDTQEGAYKITITPWEREIYVITMIKIKINEHCDKLARGEASEFGK